ncbi:collagen alpha-1(XII) chain-like [Mya arenaria]|uniref:collagen alpha-1(XII) chain-like n=1 Tax=Mya arenaria TaxID=6604 RepID=UPI0022E33714|nr:collagen alpha-1(XII) chain-like [Mya arenaria]
MIVYLAATIFLLAICGEPVSADGAAPCEDLNTAACALFLSSKPDLCQDPALSANCKRFCGLCPLVCYSCPMAVNSSDDCNNTRACDPDEVCMRKQHSYPDGSKEFILSCESKMACEGLNYGFHNIVGKRDINFHCCSADLCNLPPEFTTTMAPPPTTTVPTTTLRQLHRCARDVVFVLDGSTSIGTSNHLFLRNFVTAVINYLSIGTDDTLMGLVEYSDSARVEWYLTDHMTKKDLLTASLNIPYVRGSTATNAAFWLVRNSVLTSAHGNRPNAQDVVVLVTDGGTNNAEMAVNEAKLLHNSGVEVVAIGVGASVESAELDQYKTSYTVKVNSYTDLRNIANAVAHYICQ